MSGTPDSPARESLTVARLATTYGTHKQEVKASWAVLLFCLNCLGMVNRFRVSTGDVSGKNTWQCSERAQTSSQSIGNAFHRLDNCILQKAQ